MSGSPNNSLCEKNKPEHGAEELTAKRLIDRLPIMICTFREDGTLTFVNQAYADYFQKPKNRLIGQNWLNFLPDDEKERVRARYTRLTPDHHAITHQHRVIDADGRLCWHEWTDIAVFDQNGELVEYQSTGVDITQRKVAEEQLRKEQEKFSSVVKHIPQMIFQIDRNGRLTFANHAFEKTFGSTANALLGKCGHDFFEQNMADKYCADNEMVMSEDREMHTIEEYVAPLSGELEIMEVAKVPLHDEYGAVIGMQGIVWPITSLIMAKRALEESEYRLRTIFNAAKGVALVMADIVDQDIIISEFSPGAVKIFGYDRDAMIGRSLLALVPGEENASYLEMVHLLDGQTTEKTVEIKLLRQSGQTFTALHTIHAISAPQSGKKGLLAVSIDIDEQKMAAQALCESEERLRAIFQTSADPIVLYDTHGFPLLINPAFTKVFGWTLEDIQGIHIPYVPDDQKAFTLRKIKELYESNAPVRLETKRYTKAGRLLDVLISAGLIKGAGGENVGMVVNLTNITENKKLETHIQQAQKLEAIGTLAGGIAHDFNNILSAIIGYTELSISMIEHDSLIRANLEKISTAGNRAAALVKQILTFSRQAEQELRPLQPKYIIKEALKLIRASLPSSIMINPDLESEAYINGDPTQVHQIVMNLCTNAAQAAREGQGCIQVRLRDAVIDKYDADTQPDLHPGKYIKMIVQDNGSGMTQEVKERIFDPFFTTKPKDMGTGMGLSLVHGIVKSYRGTITVDSEINKGTTFTVFLPVLGENAGQQNEDLPPPIPTGNERLLLVDDEAPLVEIGKKMMERLGYSVTGVTSSIEALKLFKQAPDQFDLLITDLTMPNLTGYRLTAEALKIRPDIPIIICTGFGEMINDHDIHMVGIRKVVLKPIIMRDIGAAIREVLDGRPEKRR